MLTKRIIPCLDVKNGRVVKGTSFEMLRDAGDAVALARRYDEEGADELVFLDITASAERRKTIVKLASAVAKEVFIPFTIGGGIRTIKDIEKLLRAGADKVSINTAAVENPKLISQASREFGSQAIVVAIDAKKNGSKWDVYIYSGKKKTNLDAINWSRKVALLGCGEILLTSIDYDGTKNGYDLELVKAVAQSVTIPVIASGGAGQKQDFLEVFKKTKVAAALAAGLFHYGKIRIPELKKYLKQKGVEIRGV